MRNKDHFIEAYEKWLQENFPSYSDSCDYIGSVLFAEFSEEE